VRCIVKIIDTPERIHREHYEKIKKLFEPTYYIVSTFYQNEYSIEKRRESGGSNKYGTLSIAENNKDVTIKGDQKRFIDIANEIEKLGYSVTIID